MNQNSGRRAARVVTLVLALAGVQGTARADIRRDAPRATVGVNAGYQPTSLDFTQQTPAFEELQEVGNFSAGYRTGRGPCLDVSVAVHVRRMIAVGLAVSAVTTNEKADLHARVPHPFFFERLREINGQSGRLRRGELGLHPFLAWVHPLNRRANLMIGGGPSWLRVQQELVTDLSLEEAYPYEEAVIATSATRSQNKSGIGFHVGADLTYRWTSHVGFGALVRFSKASVKLQGPDGQTISTRPRDFRTAAGLRLAF